MKIDIIQKILNRNGYQLTEENLDKFIITQLVGGNSKLGTGHFIGFFMIATGLLVFWFSIKLGITILIASVPVLLRTSKQMQVEKHLSDRKIIIEPGLIKLIDPNQKFEFSSEEIEELSYYLEKDKNTPAAGIEIISNTKENVLIIEIHGEDKRFIQDDIEKLVNFILGIINK